MFILYSSYPCMYITHITYYTHYIIHILHLMYNIWILLKHCCCCCSEIQNQKLNSPKSKQRNIYFLFYTVTTFMHTEHHHRPMPLKKGKKGINYISLKMILSIWNCGFVSFVLHPCWITCLPRVFPYAAKLSMVSTYNALKTKPLTSSKN